MDNKQVGEEIKNARKLAGITQEQLAKRINKTKSSVQKYEQGLVTIPWPVLEKIGVALDAVPFYSADFDRIRFYSLHDDNIKEYPRVQKSLNAELLKMYINPEPAFALYKNLNDIGQNKALEYIKDLSEIPRYQRGPAPDPEQEQTE